jgi:hypothetical protein
MPPIGAVVSSSRLLDFEPAAALGTRNTFAIASGLDEDAALLPLAVLAVLFDRLGRYAPAATVVGFALSPFSAAGVPDITTVITHLRDVLGEATYESLARKGATMTTTEIVTYAYDQIDQARTELNAVSK